jgi:hypothetical protein
MQLHFFYRVIANINKQSILKIQGKHRMKKLFSFLFIAILTGFQVCAADNSNRNQLTSGKDTELRCPGNQHVIGMRERCSTTGCLIDILHCS